MKLPTPTVLKLSKKLLYKANKRSEEKKQMFCTVEDYKEKQQVPVRNYLMQDWKSIKRVLITY